MRDIELQAESIQLSIYSEIILNALSTHKELSLMKTIVFAYLIKQHKLESYQVYDGRHTSDVLFKCLSLLSGNFEEYCNSVEYIIKSVDLLHKNNLIVIDGEILKSNEDFRNLINKKNENPFLNKAIEESKSWSDKQFIKEVLSNV